MKAVYDTKADIFTLQLAPGPVAETHEQKPGVILDYDADGNLVGLEILDASMHVNEPTVMNFHIVG